MTELQQRALAVALREHQEEQRKKAEEQARKDAGDERLLCAVLYEGKGEPN